MAESCLNFAKQETERLNKEIEALQGKIRLHDETKSAWGTILRNAENESQAAYLDLANSETARLDGEIETVQEEIRRHTETMSAWDRIMQNAGSESRISQGITYLKGEDGQWHQQRLDTEIEVLRGRIRLCNETKDAWETVVHHAVSESLTECMDLAKAETARLNGEIEAAQQEINRRQETKNAWDTIMRNAVSERRIFQGAMYMKGWDGQWHLQPAQAIESDEEDGLRAVTKVNSVRQAFLGACARTFSGPRKRIVPVTHGKQGFQSLGLR